jgi:pimeloyl-ACP methyl ester carboxylesterase
VRLADLARLTALLARLSRPPGGEASPRVEERRDLRTAATGTAYDLYAPCGTTRAALVALHGVAAHGRTDARLVHFGRSLARGGVLCAVPTLPGLADGRWDAQDIDAIVDVVSEMPSRRVGLVGFCYGASYGLVAAARPQIAARVPFVVCFGAYHALPDLFDEYVASRERQPAADEWDNWIYLHVVLARQHLPPGELREASHALFERYCHGVTPGEKRAFYEERLRSLDLIRIGDRARDAATLKALSPAGHLATLQATVSLIHDPRDIIVPPVHAQRLHAELQALPDRRRHRVLVTSLVSHVELAHVLHPGEIWRLCAALEPVVRVADP